VYPADLLGSFYLLAGIDANANLPNPEGWMPACWTRNGKA